jgi:hypothetical protein
MKTKEILEIVIHTLNPTLEDAIDKLRVEDIGYFIHHLALDLQKSLYEWKLKSAKKYEKQNL